MGETAAGAVDGPADAGPGRGGPYTLGLFAMFLEDAVVGGLLGGEGCFA